MALTGLRNGVGWQASKLNTEDKINSTTTYHIGMKS